jgi:hypothetical protein
VAGENVWPALLLGLCGRIETVDEPLLHQRMGPGKRFRDLQCSFGGTRILKEHELV